MRILKELDRQSFEGRFGDDKSCDEFLAGLKWPEGYHCTRCAGTIYIKGKNFPMLHIQIRNFKNWLRGVHFYCNREYLQRYIDEYFFRFNRRNHRGTILDKIIERCVNHPPATYGQLKVIAN